jgi:hypothetical protein
MKLWYLRPRGLFAPFNQNGVGLLIRAETEADARELAATLQWVAVALRDDRWLSAITVACLPLDVKNKGDLTIRLLADPPSTGALE